MLNGSIESTDTNVGDWDIDVIMLRTWTAAVLDMELNLEVQWTSLATYSGTPERISITTGAFNSSEDLGVYEWNNVDTWIFLDNLTASSENNFTISYLTGATYTIKFEAWDESGDTEVSEWEIDVVLICPTPFDILGPNLVYDYPGTATQNNTAIALWTIIIGNWTIDDACDNPDSFIIFSNSTGTNLTKSSGSFIDGDYKGWQYDNDNTTNVDLVVFIQIVVNDSIGNANSSIGFYTVSSIFSLAITETTFNWTRPNVVMDSGEWVYVDEPAKQYLNMSIMGSSNWEVRGYINDTSSELHVKTYITNSTGESMPEVETFWDGSGTELTDSEQVIAGAGNNQPAGDYTSSEGQYQLWIVVQIDDGGYRGGQMWVLITMVIYSE
jgi:major membrane immunogen (membrane-anchored lipoprotein)